MVMTIELKPEVEAGLRQRAQDAGCDTSGYVQRLIARDLAGPVNIRDLFAPVREQIRASQVTDEELDALLEGACRWRP